MTYVYDYMKSKNRREPSLHEMNLVCEQEEKVRAIRRRYDNNFQQWTREQRSRTWAEYLKEDQKHIDLFCQYCGYVLD